MAKKLWTVTMEAEVVVVADSEEEARDAAEQAVIDVDLEMHPVQMHSMPCGWAHAIRAAENGCEAGK